MGSNAYTLTQGAAAFSSPAFSFTRNVTTVDDYGVQVAANVPRFGKPVAVAGSTATSIALAVKASNHAEKGQP